MPDTPNKPQSLNVAGDDVTPLRPIPPLEQSFPSSAKITIGELDVPMRRIDLEGDNPSIVVYDTTGPQGLDPRQGLPKRRQPWTEARRERAEADGNWSQMHFARAGIITDEIDVIETVVPLLFVAAVFQLSDGVQAVAAGALRGAGDTRFPLLANLGGHYLVGLPLGVALGFGLGLGARGLWWGLSAGLTCVAVALALRFWHASSRPIARA